MADDSIKYSDLFPDDGGIDALIKKIQEVEAVYKKVSKLVIDQTKKIKQETEDLNTTDDKSTDLLKKKEKELEKILKQMEDLEEVEDDLITQKKQALKLAKEEQKLIEKRNNLTTDAAKRNASLKIEISELNKELKEQAKESAGLIGEYDRQSKRLNTLRKQYKNLAAEGKANTEEAQKLLLAVTELDAELKDIDKSVGQTQRSVGDYRDAVKGAIADTGLWGDESGVLGGILGKLGLVVEFLKKAQEANAEEMKESVVITNLQDKASKGATRSQRNFARAQLLGAKATKIFNKALKASPIFILIGAFGALISFLSRTQEGLDKVSVVVESAGQIFEVLVKRLSTVGKSIFKVGEGIVNVFKGIASAATLKFKEAGKAFDQAGKDFTEAWDTAKESVEDLNDELTEAQKQGRLIAKLEKQRRIDAVALKKEIALLNAESERGEEIEGDNTRSFEERKKAIIASANAQKQSSELSKKLIEDEITVLKERQRLKELTVADAEELAELEVELIEATTEATIKGLALRRIANQLEQDLLEKNLDILIDGFDNQKTINEQLIADEKRKFVERKSLIEQTNQLRQKAFNAEIEQIQKTTDLEIDTVELQKILASGDSIRLNEKIRLLGLSEILEGRLLEVLRENNTATNDLKVADKELNESRVAFLKEVIQATDDLKVANETNLEAQAELEEKYRFEKVNAELDAQLKVAEGDIELTEELLKKKEELNKEHNRIVAKNKTDAFVEANSREAKELEIGLLEQGKTQKEIQQALTDDRISDLENEIKLKKELNQDSLNDELELARLKADEERKIEEEKFKEMTAIRDSFVNGTLDGIDKVLEKRIAANEKEQDDIKNQISKQQELAKDGLTNTLAFEEAELAKAEQKKIELEKQRVRVEEIKALYSAYSAAASAGDSDAITKALRDFAILRATSAAVQSFGEGTGEHGTFADAIDARTGGSRGGNSLLGGVFRGAKHDSKGRGGIPVLVEGNEGLLSSNQMNKFGKSNFIKLTKGIDNGTIGTDFFGGQIEMIPQNNVISMNLGSLEGKLDSVQKAIENKPVPSLHAESISESITDIVHTVSTGSKTVKSRYRINKKRL